MYSSPQFQVGSVDPLMLSRSDDFRYADDLKQLVPHVWTDTDARSKDHSMLRDPEKKYGERFPRKRTDITEVG